MYFQIMILRAVTQSKILVNSNGPEEHASLMSHWNVGVHGQGNTVCHKSEDNSVQWKTYTLSRHHAY